MKPQGAMILCACAIVAAPVEAHEASDQPGGPAKLHVGQDTEIGSYLVDQAGMSVYLFEADSRGADGAKPESNCHEGCALSWPPVITEGAPEAHDDLNAELVGTLERADGDVQVTYNGWPLYYFASDLSPGHLRGHDVELDGGEWYLITPDGEKAGEDH